MNTVRYLKRGLKIFIDASQDRSRVIHIILKKCLRGEHKLQHCGLFFFFLRPKFPSLTTDAYHKLSFSCSQSLFSVGICVVDSRSENTMPSAYGRKFSACLCLPFTRGKFEATRVIRESSFSTTIASYEGIWTSRDYDDYCTKLRIE